MLPERTDPSTRSCAIFEVISISKKPGPPTWQAGFFMPTISHQGRPKPDCHRPCHA